MNILYPVFALVALTLVVLTRLGLMRAAAAARGEVDPRYYKAYRGEEPERLHIVSRHLVNLLEVPLLFYLACLIAFLTQQSGVLPITLAWAYVALRLVHTGIHLGSNVVIWRFRVFVLSVIVLISLWVVLFLGIFLR